MSTRNIDVHYFERTAKDVKTGVKKRNSDDPLSVVILQMTVAAVKNMKTMPLLTLLLGSLAICLPILGSDAAKPPAPVYINKCCRIGEQLDANGECTFGGPDQWWPAIFLIMKKTIFEPLGEAPRFFRVNEETRPQCHSPELISGGHSVHSVALFSNGTLYISDRTEMVDIENYCVDKDKALICSPHNTQNDNSVNRPINRTIVRKCCSKEAIYQRGTDAVCEELSDGHEIIGRKLVQNTTNELEYRYGFPVCSKSSNNFAIVGKFNESKFDESTGNLTLAAGVFQSHQYCLEHFNETGTVNVHVFMCDEYLPTSDKPGKASESRLKLNLIGCALLISVVFLITTLATGFILPTNHHVLHWRCQTYYVACLIVGDILLAIVQLSGNAIEVKSFQCVSVAISVHFCYLVAFFWLNAMCTNIWWTFHDFRPSTLEKVQEKVRLRIYQAYAFGIPLIIMAIAIILDNIPNGDFLRPQFGQTRCGFDGDKELLAYFFGPVGFLLFVNFLLFASTARQLTCGLWKRDEVKSTTERAALGRVCIKLVVVMGITWILDVLSWIHTTLDDGNRHAFWIISDLINALHGVFIFIVVGCQPQVLIAIKRFWSLKVGRSTANTANGPQHSSSSHGLPSIGESVTNNTFTNNSFTTNTTKVPLETVC